MSVSFWKAEGKIPIEQTSNAVGALNGLNFSGGQQVRIKVPPSTKFIKPDECYINADFLIEREASPNFETILQLGQSLIKDISIYSSAERGSVLLEQITNYNSMVSVMRDYDTNDSDKNRRALTEGGTVWKPDTRGTLGTTVSDCADCTPTNPYFTAPFNSSGNKVSKTTTFQTVKLCIPLETGIFRSSTVWANMFYIEHANSNITPAQCGFIVGEKINFVSPDNASTAGFASENVISQVNASASANGGAGLVEIVLTGNASNTGGSVIKNSWFMFSESISSDSAFKPTYKLENVELVVQEVDMGQNYVNDVLGSMKKKE